MSCLNSLGLALLLSLRAGAGIVPSPPPETTGPDAPAVHPLHLSTAQLLVERSEAFLRIRMFKNDLEQALSAHAGARALSLEPTPSAEKEEGEPTAIPRSHLTDLRNAPETVGDRVVGARHVCTACHVPVGATRPLVRNRFDQ